MAPRLAGLSALFLALALGACRDSTGPEAELLGDGAYGTPILIPGNASKALQHFVVGDKVMAVSGFARNGSGLQFQWSEETVRFSSGTGPQYHAPAMFYIRYAEDRTLMVNPGHLFLLADGTLVTAAHLKPSDPLVSVDGAPVAIREIVLAQYSGGIHNIATSLDFDGRIEGHLLGMNGVVTGDYVLQLHWPLLHPEMSW